MTKLTNETLSCLKEKVDFVNKISKALEKNDKLSIDHITYDVFVTKYDILCEYLVVTYKGGACAVRVCNGNSLSAIFDEIAKLFNGGYYDEVHEYREYKLESKNIF